LSHVKKAQSDRLLVGGNIVIRIKRTRYVVVDTGRSGQWGSDDQILSSTPVSARLERRPADARACADGRGV